ncbi:Translation initiation factor 1A [Coemansia sp. RSA 376]|nr:Translation initiation factor 1A [Coemansia sp. RSA 376]
MEKQESGVPSGNAFVEAPKQLVKEATWLLRRCTKPNRKEYLKIVYAVVMGFLVMGFVGYFTKLVHIPINNIIGGKSRRRGKNDADPVKRELVFKEEGQEYAVVVKMLGNGRVSAKCFDKETRIAQIRGSMRKKVWINVGDIILVSLRDFQDNIADIILKYNPDEARDLKTYGELPEDTKIEDNEAGSDEEDGDIEFDIDEI